MRPPSVRGPWRTDVSFCVAALEEALLRFGRPEIFNTDQGSQFTSAAFTGTLAAAGIRISMDGRGRWMDNVFIERLWRSLKYEDVYLKVAAGHHLDVHLSIDPVGRPGFGMMTSGSFYHSVAKYSGRLATVYANGRGTRGDMIATLGGRQEGPFAETVNTPLHHEDFREMTAPFFGTN